MDNERQDFESFMRRREEAARAYVAGDPDPLKRIAARRSPASFFGPQGGSHEGADQVWDAYAHGAAALSPGGETHFEVLHLAAGDGLAYWVGLQRATVMIGGRAEPTPMDLRVTEVFRREDGEWRLIHRHADQLAVPAE